MRVDRQEPQRDEHHAVTGMFVPEFEVGSLLDDLANEGQYPPEHDVCIQLETNRRHPPVSPISHFQGCLVKDPRLIEKHSEKALRHHGRVAADPVGVIKEVEDDLEMVTH
jgi:hypothetical protein